MAANKAEAEKNFDHFIQRFYFLRQLFGWSFLISIGRYRGWIPAISKKGKAALRYALYQAALIASTRDEDFRRYFSQA